MALERFPDNIKPVVNQGYTFGAPQNILEQLVQGGTPLQIKDTKYGPVAFTVTVVGSLLKQQAWQDFYFGKINAGADKFIMELDSGNGLEDHIVQIVPSSVQHNSVNDPTRVISYTILAESTPFQDNPYGGGLAELYDLYGEDLPALLDRLAIFTLIDLPTNWSP